MERPGAVVAPTGWIVVMSRRGAPAGAVGPFPDRSDAEAWAAELPAADRDWTWSIEPLLDGADLRRAAPPRRHLRLVK